MASPPESEREAPLEGGGARAIPLTPAEKQNDYHERLCTDGAVQDQNIRKQAALTSAQKQKAYREKHGDKVREANRLRMKKKREDEK